MASNMASDKIFVDTSVIIAALLSPTGGSSYLLETYRETFDFLINEHILKETSRLLTDKFAGDLTAEDFFRLAKSIKLKVVTNPPSRTLKTLEGIIEKDDRAILVSAFEQADYLLTLDNHFFSEAVLKCALILGLRILKPKDFIELHRVD